MLNKTTGGVLLAIVSVLVIGAIVLVSGNYDGNPTTNEKNQSTTQMDSPTKQSNIDTSSDAASRQQSNSEASQGTVVDIKNSAYLPQKIQIKKGSTVTWTNQDTTRHDIMPDQNGDSFKASELLAKGESYSFTFDEVGTYTYHCTPHPFMKGTVEVIE